MYLLSIYKEKVFTLIFMIVGGILASSMIFIGALSFTFIITKILFSVPLLILLFIIYNKIIKSILIDEKQKRNKIKEKSLEKYYDEIDKNRNERKKLKELTTSLEENYKIENEQIENEINDNEYKIINLKSSRKSLINLRKKTILQMEDLLDSKGIVIPDYEYSEDEKIILNLNKGGRK